MTEQPPAQSGGYPLPPPPGGSQSPSPGAVWPPPLGQPVDDLPTEAYASWIRRVGAFIIDQIVYLTLVVILGLGGGLIVGAAGGSSRLEGIVQSILTLVVLVFLIWNWGYRQGTTGSTIGKSVLKFKVVDERTGQPIGFGLSIVRYFAHFIDSIIFGIGYLLPLFTAKRQTIADMIMSTVCLPDEPPLARRNRTPRPRIRMSVGVVVLAIAAILTVLACLTSTSRWVCTGSGPYPDCGPRVSVGPISYGAAGNFVDPYVLAAFVPPLWTAGILILRRYYRATYALVPIAGIVAIMIFAQGRYDWGWERNYFAFLACVFVTTAVCVLIARGITRSVAARQAEAAAYRERKAAREQRLTPTLPPPGWYPDPGDARRQRHWDGRQWTEQWR
jgi:uncharacterized RDD family membrane protein YckC